MHFKSLTILAASVALAQAKPLRARQYTWAPWSSTSSAAASTTVETTTSAVETTPNTVTYTVTLTASGSVPTDFNNHVTASPSGGEDESTSTVRSTSTTTKTLTLYPEESETAVDGTGNGAAPTGGAGTPVLDTTQAFATPTGVNQGKDVEDASGSGSGDCGVVSTMTVTVDHTITVTPTGVAATTTDFAQSTATGVLPSFPAGNGTDVGGQATSSGFLTQTTPTSALPTGSAISTWMNW